MLFAICILISAIFVISFPLMLIICCLYPTIGVKILLGALILVTISCGVIFRDPHFDDSEVDEIISADIERKSA